MNPPGPFKGMLLYCYYIIYFQYNKKYNSYNSDILSKILSGYLHIRNLLIYGAKIKK